MVCRQAWPRNDLWGRHWKRHIQSGEIYFFVFFYPKDLGEYEKKSPCRQKKGYTRRSKKGFRSSLACMKKAEELLIGIGPKRQINGILCKLGAYARTD